MLIIPPKFMEVMKEWLTMKLSHVMSLSANKWREFWVQVQTFKGRMVLGRVQEYLCRRHRIVAGDLVVLRISGLDLKVQVYNHDNSIVCRVCCSRHNCIGYVAFAL
ncbi:hypothetical protein D1007_35375 [Hordeum vulgare]|nr:hypothetical protein D1007_35375 [Hordeum vulgare]